MHEEDMERYKEHLELVKKHLVHVPPKENATSYRMYLEDCLKDAEDPKQAQKDAKAAWDKMSLEQKAKWNDRRKENNELHSNLKKRAMTAYALFVQDKANKNVGFKEVGAMWQKASAKEKEKYEEMAEAEKEKKEKERELYETATGAKPRKPHGAYKFFIMEAAKEGRFGDKNPIREGPKEWKKLSESEKERYQRIAHKSKLAYAFKMMEYKKILKSGTKRPLSAYNCFIKEAAPKAPASANKTQGGLFQHLTKQWAKLNESEKKKNHAMAEKSKKEAEKENEANEGRIYDVPKRPGSAWTLFIQQNYDQIRSENKKLDFTEMFAQASTVYKKLSAKEHKKYQDEADAATELYKGQMKDFEHNGYHFADKHESVLRKRAPMKEEKTPTRGKSRSKSKGKRAKKSSD